MFVFGCIVSFSLPIFATIRLSNCNKFHLMFLRFGAGLSFVNCCWRIVRHHCCIKPCCNCKLEWIALFLTVNSIAESRDSYWIKTNPNIKCGIKRRLQLFQSTFAILFPPVTHLHSIWQLIGDRRPPTPNHRQTAFKLYRTYKPIASLFGSWLFFTMVYLQGSLN